MSGIKNIKPTDKSGFKQGYFTPINLKKYVGKYPIIYRSSWELKFCHFCDNSEDIVLWSSETFEIKYFNILDQKYHKYYPDFYVKKKINEDTFIEFIVEIKPSSQLKKPEYPKSNRKKVLESYRYACNTYITNICKIDALKKFAESRNYKWVLLTEKTKHIF